MAKVALAAVRGHKKLAELEQQHDVHPNRITDWRNQLLAEAADVFGGEPRPDEPTVHLKVLHAKIGQLTLKKDFLKGALIKRRHAKRKVMIDRIHRLPITRQLRSWASAVAPSTTRTSPSAMPISS